MQRKVAESVCGDRLFELRVGCDRLQPRVDHAVGRSLGVALGAPGDDEVVGTVLVSCVSQRHLHVVFHLEETCTTCGEGGVEQSLNWRHEARVHEDPRKDQEVGREGDTWGREQLLPPPRRQLYMSMALQYD